MENLLSKISLYDILSMVIPGGTILLFLSQYAGCGWKIDNTLIEEKIFYFIAISLAYVIGVVNHVISYKLWEFFRNNPMLICKGYEQFANELDKNSFQKNISCSSICNCICVFLCLPSIFFYIVIIWSILSNFKCFVVFIVAIIILAIIIIKLICLANKEIKYDAGNLMNDYYDAYYVLEAKGKLGKISIIEGQIAFIESMTIPLFLFTLLPENSWKHLLPCTTSSCCVCCIKFLILLLCILFIYVVYKRVIKVHYLVWCDSHYYEKQDSLINTK